MNMHKKQSGLSFAAASASKRFAVRVYALLRTVPRGKVTTYGALAGMARAPRKARYVGYLMSENHDPSIPCHRVVESNGALGGYNGNLGKKEALLRQEGIGIKNGKIDLEKYRFNFKY